MHGMLANTSLSTATRLLDRVSDGALDWVLTKGISVVATVLIAGLLLRLGTTVIDRIQARLQVSPRADVNARVTQRSLTLTTILRSTLKTVILFAATLSLLSAVGINITPILASAGVVGLAVGFGAQSLVKDVITGFFILLEDQYGVGDVVKINDKSGLVEKMNLRITQLRNLSGELITIPNGQVSIVSNQSKEWARALLEIGVAYEADIDHVLKVMVDEGSRLHAEWPDKVLEEPEVNGIQSFGDSSIQLRVVMKTAPLKQWEVASEWRRRVKFAFDREGISIPYPQRVLRIVPEAKGLEELDRLV